MQAGHRNALECLGPPHGITGAHERQLGQDLLDFVQSH
jgi:hypothetical protein